MHLLISALNITLILFRVIGGIMDSAAWVSLMAILLKLFQDKAATIMSWTETVFGLGYTIGK